MARPVQYGEDHRRLLLDAAARIMAAEGPGGLSLRGVAAEVGVSTTAVYSLVGNKRALEREVSLAAIESFTRAQESARRGEDPVDDLSYLGRSYRQWALDNPALYRVMFGGRSQVLPEGPRALVPLTQTLEILDAQGRLAGSVGEATYSIWACVHGAVSLELSGPGPWADTYPALLRSLGRAWVIGVPEKYRS
ncbi:TetR/AcrR family transcriptional regulator [Falsarthrobacter nasiphocae]|uniref:AcrR family transcriptional regulator n=1 Tax=Falsarthrobacter nasiphocae TaxID=189863 RepID=A0AAE4C788_9MICC|nr:TetR/AcrR family transcriptional regulator [Falsarthrobacter nasiphocae]MDR6892299.1 AcrR family transcriptional regulator [Falsarthrobacter nasiphocae]